ncbi:MAG TPA: TIGR00730 family Rossman fold protein [Candidatus Paceibacterota bacterium]|nr:TIGR00730 family Rossman fold protein [Candidatus Paceibacterota bacterium]
MNDDHTADLPQVNLPSKQLPIKPLTLAELRESEEKREAEINKEFREGFEFLESYDKSVTFFGSARLKPQNEYYLKAQHLAYRIANELGYAVITGGGPGIMEAANRGAFEAGGESLGMTIRLPHEQVTNPYLTGHENFYYFFSRKVMMTFSAEAYVYFPGGFGTLDEFFEILTLVQTNKIEKVPLILVGDAYWKNLEKFIVDTILTGEMIDPEDLHLFTITEDEDKIIEMIRNTRVRNGVKYHYDN